MFFMCKLIVVIVYCIVDLADIPELLSNYILDFYEWMLIYVIPFFFWDNPKVYIHGPSELLQSNRIHRLPVIRIIENKDVKMTTATPCSPLSFFCISHRLCVIYTHEIFT
ncbi:hypothetical protein L1887_30501 [Cichorium endivia]|nr:hypothetical protein L1887_30501 [Cichorium endivia]